MSALNHTIGAAAPAVGRQFTGGMMLAAMLACFGAVFAANGALIYFALTTFSGEEEPSPYEHGLAYDKDIAAARAQDARGWHVTVAARRVQPAGAANVAISARDAQGRPLEGLGVSAALEFPADKKFDQNMVLSERSPGEYSGEGPLRPGQWDVVVNARKGGELLFRSRNRLDLP